MTILGLFSKKARLQDDIKTINNIHNNDIKATNKKIDDLVEEYTPGVFTTPMGDLFLVIVLAVFVPFAGWIIFAGYVFVKIINALKASMFPLEGQIAKLNKRLGKLEDKAQKKIQKLQTELAQLA